MRFSHSSPYLADLSDILECVVPQVTQEKNKKLVSPFTIDEVKKGSF